MEILGHIPQQISLGKNTLILFLNKERGWGGIFTLDMKAHIGRPYIHMVGTCKVFTGMDNKVNSGKL